VLLGLQENPDVTRSSIVCLAEKYIQVVGALDSLTLHSNQLFTVENEQIDLKATNFCEGLFVFSFPFPGTLVKKR
jgi:hypothetical protein